MSDNEHSHRELGQTAVLFALMIIGLVAFVGLGVDGGHVLNERRITQNAADASALGGVRYMATSEDPNEITLLSRVNSVVEANGLPDSDGTPGNEVNDFIVAYYTDERGDRIGPPNCGVVGTCGVGGTAGRVPPYAFGLEVQVTNPVDTFLLGVIGQNTVDIGADAVAVARGFAPTGEGENLMVATGVCPSVDDEHYQLTGRGNNNEFLGGMVANATFESPGRNNHYHGQVVSYYPPPADKLGTNTVYEPGEPVTMTTPVADPFAGWSHVHFAPGSEIALAHAANYYDAEKFDLAAYGGNGDGIIAMSEIRDQTYYPFDLYNDSNTAVDAGEGVTLNPYQMRTGIYYAGGLEIRIGGGGRGVNGTITVVGGHLIKITAERVNFTAYMPPDLGYSGLLFFSDYALPDVDACDFEEAGRRPIIWMSGGGNARFEVDHDTEECPYPQINGCYVPTNNVFTGLIYAQNGRIKTAENNTTYIGALVGFSIDFSGERNLFVTNSALYPTSDPRIFLER